MYKWNVFGWKRASQLITTADIYLEKASSVIIYGEKYEQDIKKSEEQRLKSTNKRIVWQKTALSRNEWFPFVSANENSRDCTSRTEQK